MKVINIQKVLQKSEILEDIFFPFFLCKISTLFAKFVSLLFLMLVFIGQVVFSFGKFVGFILTIRVL